jgi:maltose alpha-D-glucosyltransferase/alpha-amylase
MQWGAADPGITYLPPDPAPDRPNVAQQRADPDSLLHVVRSLIALRRVSPHLRTGGDVEVLSAGYPFVYRRGGRFLVAVNPGAAPAGADAPPPGDHLLGRGVRYAAGRLELDGFAYAVFRA